MPDMELSINAIQAAINMPECMIMHDLQQAKFHDQHLQHLKDYIIQGWPRAEMKWHKT